MASSWYKEFMAQHGVDVGSHRPNPRRYSGPPMDLANMRKNGAHSLLCWCLNCGHEATVNVDQLPGHLAVPSLAGRMKCSACAGKRIEVRPNWNERPNQIPHPR